MTAATEIRPLDANQAETQAAICAYLDRGTAGGWTVRDEGDTRGGLFQNREAALKFVRREFGREARIITTPSTPHLH